MKGKNHERAGKILLFFSSLFLAVNHSLYDVLIWAAFVFLFTYYFTPDLDTKSRSRKRLGFVGWIIDKIFNHRGWLHSYLFWAVLFVPLYLVFGWCSLGGLVAVYLHLVCDGLSTGFKRLNPF